MQIFITRGEEKSGPFTLDQVREQLAEGNLQPDDLATHEGLEGPVPLSELMATVGAEPSQEPAQDEAKAKDAPKKMGLFKKIFFGALISITLILCVIHYRPVPLPDIEELKTFVSKRIREVNPDNKIQSVALRVVSVVKDDSHIDFMGDIEYVCSIELTKPDGSKGNIEGTFTARYMGIDWGIIDDIMTGRLFDT